MSDPSDNLPPDEARLVFNTILDALRNASNYLDRTADNAPATPRLYLRRAVGYLTHARGFVEIAASYIDEPKTEVKP